MPRLRRLSRSAAWLAGSLLALYGVDAAAASCADRLPEPVPCDDCFAVFVMPDTQGYTRGKKQPQAGAHLAFVTRWICASSRAWVEPSTGKTMPIVAVAHLGDVVNNGDLRVDGELPQWRIADAAFDVLDACPKGPVPYLVTTGNHDYAELPGDAASRPSLYARRTAGFDRYFGAERYAAYACDDPSGCTGAPDDWFVGGGDAIPAGSRNHTAPRGRGKESGLRPGPPAEQPGRHRAIVVRAPGGRRLLLLGLEATFDAPVDGSLPAPQSHDDSAWPLRVLRDYADLPTVVVNHAWLLPRDPDAVVPAGVDFGQDHPRARPWGRFVWDLFVRDFPQVVLVSGGHWVPRGAAGAERFAAQRLPRDLDGAGPPEVVAVWSNFQSVGQVFGEQRQSHLTGDGWNTIVVFDPGARQIRARDYRIDDVDGYRTRAAFRRQKDGVVDLDHDGELPASGDLRCDWTRGEATFPWDPAAPGAKSAD